MRVVLVEDSLEIRRRLVEVVEEAGGIVVGEADNEIEAMLLILSSEPDFVVLDLQLAEGQGVNVLQKIQALSLETQSIILTSHGSEVIRTTCKRLGADYFFEKVKDFPVFEQLIRDQCQQASNC